VGPLSPLHGAYTVTDGGDGLQVWRVTVNILNKQLQTNSVTEEKCCVFKEINSIAILVPLWNYQILLTMDKVKISE
jgi:hypothetical protein